MILTNVKNFERYVSLHPMYSKVLEVIKGTDFSTRPTGRNEIDGDKLFVNNVKAQGVSADVQPMEMHKDYIDIHVLLKGAESIGYKATEEVANYSQEYNKEGDCALTKEPSTSTVNLLPGDICIVYPEDAHAPLIGSGEIEKLIFKVQL